MNKTISKIDRIRNAVTISDLPGIFFSYDEYTYTKHIDPDEPCWISKLHIESQGYTRIKIENRRRQLHIWSWEIFNQASILPGYVVDHLCLQKTCANPKHLEIVTYKENDRRARFHYDPMKTHCREGHPLIDPNIRYKNIYKNNIFIRIDRQCRICYNAQKMDSYHKTKVLKGHYETRKTHCPYGHPYDTENTIVTKRGRVCRICKLAYGAAYRVRQKMKT